MRSDANNGKYNKRLSIVIFIILTIAIVLIVGYAYAKYVTSKSGEAQAEIAEWNVAINIADNTDENVEVDLADTRNKEKEEADVQDGYVAPGTAGMFNIEVNAENSEVSLEYEITMNADYGNNEKFPKNLIFYSDENMENAFYHTGNTIELNGFIGYDDSNKKRTIPIYWKWAYQTGVTDEEKEENDGLDSEWMGKSVNPLELKVVAKQVNANQEGNPMANQYAVTLDTNGGTLEGYGNSGNVIKQVSYGGQYGELPTPTREGYTFKGWNGKNKIDINKAINEDLIDNNDGTYTMWKHSDTNRFSKFLSINIPANTKFTISYEILEYNGNYDYKLQLVDTDEKYYVKPGTYLSQKDITGIRIYQEGRQSIGTYTKFKNLQLEEGDTATPYEPYYVTSTTPVTQTKNHKLTAIWEKD